MLKIGGITESTDLEGGAVVVMLDVDGGSFSRVLVDARAYNDNRADRSVVDQAIRQLELVRAELDRMAATR